MGFKLRSLFKSAEKNILDHFHLKPPELKLHVKTKLGELFENLKLPSPKSLIPDKFPDSFKIDKFGDDLIMNGKSWRELSFYLEAGRIRKFWSEMKVPHSISEKIENVIKQKMEGHPAKKIADLEEKVASMSKSLKELDVKVKDLDKISEKKKSFLQKHWGKLLAIGGGIASIVVIKSELEKAKGCFLFHTSKEMCKWTERSCASPESPRRVDACGETNFDKHIGNPNLMLRYIKKNGNPALVGELKDALQAGVTDDAQKKYIEEEMKKLEDKKLSNEEIEKLINSPGLKDKMEGFNKAKKNDWKFTDFCSLLDKDEEKPACVACNPSAPYNSLAYFNLEDVENERPRCEENPTVLSAIMKTLGAGAKELLDALGVTDLWGSILKYVGYVIAGFLLICGLGFAGFMFSKKKGDDDEVGYSELVEEDADEHHDDKLHAT